MLANLKVGDLEDICTHHLTAVTWCIDEVLQECAQCSRVAEFDELLSCYKTPKEPETKPPQKLPEQRVAMTLLQKINFTSIISHNILVLVIHSYIYIQNFSHKGDVIHQITLTELHHALPR